MAESSEAAPEPEEDEKLDPHEYLLVVYEWRRMIQKNFLGDKRLKREKILRMDKLFTCLESWDMEVGELQYSKIIKVMRHVAVKTQGKSPPGDEEFHFRARAKVLVAKWLKIIYEDLEGYFNEFGADGDEEARAAQLENDLEFEDDTTVADSTVVDGHKHDNSAEQDEKEDAIMNMGVLNLAGRGSE